MAIIRDKKRKTFYINYKERQPDGTFKNINIRNREWSFDKVGIRYMQSIEQEAIDKDREKRKAKNNASVNISVKQLITHFFDVMKSEGITNDTIYGYSVGFRNYWLKVVDKNSQVNSAFTIYNIDKFKIYLNDKNVASSTINKHYQQLRKLVEFASVRRYIDREVASDIVELLKPIKVIKQSGDDKDNFFVNGEQDVRAFLESFNENDQEWRVPIYTLFYGALRIGEWQAITKGDIDFINGGIVINKQYTTRGELKATKTGESRIIYLPQAFITELEVFTSDLENDDLIFGGKFKNKPISRTSVRKIVNKHLKIAGIKNHITLHGLRHSFATRMFDKGYDVKEVQKHLGHANMNTTMQHYIHYTKNKERKDMNDLL